MAGTRQLQGSASRPADVILSYLIVAAILALGIAAACSHHDISRAVLLVATVALALVVALRERTTRQAEELLQSRVDQQRLLEQANLRQAAERARMIETMPGAFYRIATKNGSDTAIEYVSPRIAAITGYTADELSEADLAISGESRLSLGDIAIRGAWVGRRENRIRIRRKDGQVATIVEKTAMVEPGPDGRIVFEGLILDITDLEQRDADLAEGRRRLELAFEHIPGWLYSGVVDRTGQVVTTYRSSGVERVTGYAPAEYEAVVKFDPLAIVHPDDREIVLTSLKREAGPERVGELTFRIITKSGDIRWIRFNVRITKTQPDSHLLEGLLVDVTSSIDHLRGEQRRSRLAEAAARLIDRNVLDGDQKELFRTVIERAAQALQVKRIGVWMFEDESTIVSCDLFDSRTGVHSSGDVRRRQDWPGHFDFTDKARPQILDLTGSGSEVPEASKRELARLGIAAVIYAPIFRDGVVVGVSSFSRTWDDEVWASDEIAFTISFSDTITLILEASERRAAEQKVRAANAELARVVRALDSAVELIFVLDSDDRVIYLNAAADRVRSSTGPALGRDYRDVFIALGRQRDAQIQKLKTDVAVAGSWTGEFIVDVEGHVLVYDTHVASLPEGGMIFAATDVSGRRTEERNQRHLRARLAETEKMEAIGKLAGGIAHDFNNLVAAIRSFAGLIVHELPEISPVRTYAERIVGTSDRAAEIVRQILLFARAESAERRAISIKSILVELRHVLATAMPAGIAVEVTEPAKDLPVNGNAGQLLQVLMNLGVNAGHAMEHLGGAVQVFVEDVTLTEEAAAALTPGTHTVSRAGAETPLVHRHVRGILIPRQPYACITVRDNGPGIPGNIVHRIFEPFFTTKDKGKGTGLGLAVAHSIVAAHEGGIVVHTEAGRGTRFQIYLPRSAEAVEEAVSASPDLLSIKGRERVLIIDDEADLADALSLVLRRFGYATTVAYDPERALANFSEDPLAWDVVVTDQTMPRLTGMQLTRKLKRLNAGVQIVLCTGYGDALTETKAIQAGASAFLLKPAAPEVVAQAIRHSLARRNQVSG